MAKILTVCCDGTWNKPEQRSARQLAPTNVWKLHQMLDRTAGDGVRAQVNHYVRGVGTGYLNNVRGGVFGAGLSKNVLEAYEFLVQTYEPPVGEEPGDELFLFGFSRGAYTARSLAGLCRNVGILRREHGGRLEEAYRIYRRRNRKGGADTAQAVEFRDAYSHPHPGVRFLGVWDTVGALGIALTGNKVVDLINKPWQFHDVVLSKSVVTARHALAVDERRGAFQPAIWEPDEKEGENFDARDVAQVWFAGVHSDVGGGYADPSLAEISLHWMVAQASACGLRFRGDAFQRVAAPPPPADFAHGRAAGWYTAPNPAGELHHSCKSFYKVLPKYVRTIGTDTKQTVAESVPTRIADDAGYAGRIPPSFAAAIAQGRIAELSWPEQT